jgi:hypothetical protein
VKTQSIGDQLPNWAQNSHWAANLLELTSTLFLSAALVKIFIELVSNVGMMNCWANRVPERNNHCFVTDATIIIYSCPDIRQNDNQDNDTLHNGLHNIYNTYRHLFNVMSVIMLSVAILRVVMAIVIMLRLVEMSVILLSADILSAIILSTTILSVVMMDIIVFIAFKPSVIILSVLAPINN